MYPEMPSTTSNLFTNSANQQNQITHQPIQNIYVNTHAPPPGFAPIQAGFGQNYYDNFEGQPAYSTYTNPAYQAQGSQIPNPAGFSFHVGQMTVNAPFYGQGTPAYQYQVQQMRTHLLQRNHAVQDIPVAQPDRPILPETQSRIQWTPELHEAFTRAVEELGGCFNTTPKAILKRMKMNGITGITREQLKSHLQKVRNTAPQNSGIPDNEARMTNVTFDSGEFALVVGNTALQNKSDPQISDNEAHNHTIMTNVALDSGEFPHVDEYPTNNQSFDSDFDDFDEILQRFCDDC
ncbi:hypothetical protein DCAR_0729660 [Daucus carota subsp. sativus]|uniref:Myb-like domain-containing protein n=1 Tax=Daucus carota subsp. sativus TaxID=79200 RepID=A0A164UD58_DAUCS|nr:hypothetical protein DCAR_0729660 [Daucus carota subsp. sativus]